MTRGTRGSKYSWLGNSCCRYNIINGNLYTSNFNIYTPSLNSELSEQLSHGFEYFNRYA